MHYQNTKRKRAPKPLVDKIVLIFEIGVTPHHANGNLSQDGPYDRTTVTLSFDANKVPDNPTQDAKCIREALKMFLRADGWDQDEIDRTGYDTHTVTHLRVKGKKFYPADRTLEAQRALARQGKVAA